jgi:predicted RNase H-like nuclease (RuvC/YqgF family)
MRELRSITELSYEIRSSRTLNENLSHKEEISRLKEKIKNQSYFISDLDTKLKELNNERNSLLTVIRILQVENQNFLHYQRQQQVANFTCQY